MAVPSAPTITGQNLSDNMVRLRIRNGGGAVTYKVFRNTHALATTQLVAGIAGPYYTDKTVSDNTGYWYRVKATNGDGDSAFSNEVFVNAAQGAEHPTGDITPALRANRARIASR